jgi:hypothetical protein
MRFPAATDDPDDCDCDLRLAGEADDVFLLMDENVASR